MERFCGGIEVSDGSLAVEVIEGAGIGGNCLDDMHTAEHFRKEHWQPGISDRGVAEEASFEGYMKSDMLEAARGKVQAVMENYQPYALERHEADEIDGIVSEAEDDLL